ncbi:MAG: lysophospholipid acyltransferase family protein [Bacteroidota bacterium]
MGILIRIFYYGIFVPLSLLPFPLLYALSDVLCVLMYYVVGYRKKIVMQNLRNSFPEKTEEERVRIAKKFYKHFCDLTLESVKMFTISEKDARKHVTYFDVDVINKYFDQGKSVIVAMAHYNNWEMIAVTVDQAIKHQACAIYKPLTNQFFDKKMLDSRQKYGIKMIHYRTVKQDFERMKSELTATHFLIDQAPSQSSTPHWMTFLNQDTGVLIGTERFAKDYDYAVVFLDVQKPKRGYYTGRYVDVTGSPNSFPKGELTEIVTKMLEGYIKEKPEFWLWSHRRWKRTRENAKEHLIR